MNIWNIPAWLEKEVKARDRHCVYCGIPFLQTNRSRKSMPTWEHIINNAKIINRNNIALCCCSCNASKGAKDLSVWINSSYCLKITSIPKLFQILLSVRSKTRVTVYRNEIMALRLAMARSGSFDSHTPRARMARGQSRGP